MRRALMSSAEARPPSAKMAFMISRSRRVSFSWAGDGIVRLVAPLGAAGVFTPGAQHATGLASYCYTCSMSTTHVHLLLNHFPTVGFILAIGLFLAGIVARSD